MTFSVLGSTQDLTLSIRFVFLMHFDMHIEKRFLKNFYDRMYFLQRNLVNNKIYIIPHDNITMTSSRSEANSRRIGGK